MSKERFSALVARAGEHTSRVAAVAQPAPGFRDLPEPPPPTDGNSPPITVDVPALVAIPLAPPPVIEEKELPPPPAPPVVAKVETPSKIEPQSRSRLQSQPQKQPQQKPAKATAPPMVAKNENGKEKILKPAQMDVVRVEKPNQDNQVILGKVPELPKVAAAELPPPPSPLKPVRPTPQKPTPSKKKDSPPSSDSAPEIPEPPKPTAVAVTKPKRQIEPQPVAWVPRPPDNIQRPPGRGMKPASFKHNAGNL